MSQFVHKGDVFFGLAECCVGQCSEDIAWALALMLMLSVCALNDIPLLYVTPSEVAMFVQGTGVLLSVMC